MSVRRSVPVSAFFPGCIKPLAVYVVLACAASPSAAGELTRLSGPAVVEAEANGVSADGSVVVGTAIDFSDNSWAYRWSGGVMTNLGSLGTEAFALAVSGDGSTVVGASEMAGGRIATRWANGATTSLGTLGGTHSVAFAVSQDGSVIVGDSSLVAPTNHAFRWSGGVMTDLGVLPGGTASSAYGVSADGSVVVGQSYVGGVSRAFRWEGGVMTDLGTMGGGPSALATGVSADGSVIVGSGMIGGQERAFRWTGGVMTNLGTLPGHTGSWADGVSGDGNVVVGYASVVGAQTAIRWTQAGGMQSVADWLSAAGVSTAGWQSLERAKATNRDGSVVVGIGLVSGDPSSQAFIARVGGASGNGATNGIVGLTDLARSLTQTVSLPSQALLLTNLALNGAHHRTLMDMPMASRQSCAWVSGDFGDVRRNGNGAIGLAEGGVCRDFADRSLRVGVGIGTSHSRLDLANNGRGQLDGHYVLAEADWAVPETSIVASLVGYYGRWDADLRRGYAASGTTPSTGSTVIDDTTLRARIDWRDAFSLGDTRFTPSVAYTHSRIGIGAYSETGGSAPATFGSRSHEAAELRASLSAGHALSDATALRGTVEAVHRFDQESDSVAVSNVLGVTTLGMTLPGSRVRRDWMRLGLDVDHRLDARSLISFSGHVASAGHDADVSVGVSYKFAF